MSVALPAVKLTSAQAQQARNVVAQKNSANLIDMQDFAQAQRERIQRFNQRAFNKKTGYAIPLFPLMEAHLEGLDEGMFLFAAESNVGKSALMMSALYSACTCEENKLCGLYVSLDDQEDDIFSRIIAMQQMIPISVAAKPTRWETAIAESPEKENVYRDWLNKREEGIKSLTDVSGRFVLVDSEEIKSGEKLLDYMKKYQCYVRATKGEDWNIIVAIDSLSDIRFADQPKLQERALHDYIAKTVKDWTKELHIPIFGSVHMRKLNGNRRPTLDDLKESGEYVYESSVTFLLHNDVSKNQEAANVFYQGEDPEEGKQPIIEIHWAKNKRSSYKKRSYCFFAPGMSYVEECPKDASKRYDAIVYAS